MAVAKKDTRIKKEIKTLKTEYSGIDEAHKLIADRVIDQAAYQRVTLDDLKADLDANGTTEFVQRSDGIEKEMKRPNVDVYISLNAQYLRSLKQLDSMLPKDSSAGRADALTDFLSNG